VWHAFISNLLLDDDWIGP